MQMECTYYVLSKQKIYIVLKITCWYLKDIFFTVFNKYSTKETIIFYNMRNVDFHIIMKKQMQW